MPAIAYLPGAHVQGLSLQELGLNPAFVGEGFPAHQLFKSERSQALTWKERYYKCTQHDHKMFDFWGRPRRSGSPHVSQPFISGSMHSFYVPMDARRPSAPYRLGKTIVSRFTGMVFGEGRWPTVVSDDPLTQDFATALVEAMSLQDKMIRARNKGGASGSVGVSWWIKEGVPRVRIHSARHIHVLEWEDEDEQIPAHVVELLQFSKTDYTKSKPKQVWFWSRRDWTPQADVVFQPVPVEASEKNPRVWLVDEQQSFAHHDGEVHFVWIENLPTDDDITTSDGLADYDGCYEQLDTLDTLNSVHTKGVTVNLDPTLVLGLHPEEIGDAVVKKGSDNALAVGPGGTATYLTLGGDVVTAGQAAINGQRDQVLETCECVVADPDEVVAAGTSSVALKLLYTPMINRCDLLRTAYGQRGVQRLLDQIIRSTRKVLPDIDQQDPTLRYVHEVQMHEDGSPVVDENGEPVLEPVEYTLQLPPRSEEVHVLDDAGNPTGEVETIYHERHPGKGSIQLEWPPYFTKTAAESQQDASALTAANGGKPLMSQRTSIEQWSLQSNRDPQEEYARIVVEQEQAAQAQAAAQAGMFPPFSGSGIPEEPTPEEEEASPEPTTPPAPEG